MTKLTNQLSVTPNGCIQVREVRDGSYFRYVLTPVDNVEDQPPYIKDLASKTWTPEVVQAYKDQLEASIIL